MGSFIKYVCGLQAQWLDRKEGESNDDLTVHGAAIAAGVVKSLSGADDSVQQHRSIQLFRGMVLAARILDLHSAPASMPRAHKVSAMTMYYCRK